MVKKQVVTGVPCPSCGRKVPEPTLLRCVICRSLFCEHCSVFGYGREFCSRLCREFFFHGDDDEVPE